MIARHEFEYIMGNTQHEGNRKSIGGYHAWIKIPNTKLSIIKSTNREVNFLVDPTHSELLPEKPFVDNRYEWRHPSSET